LSEHVELLGYQPYEKLQYYLGAADAAILPMIDTIFDRARVPGRLCEYLASGRPIVSNAVGDVKDILEEHDCGLTSDPNNINAFAENIIRILNEEELQRRLGNNARKTAEEKYSWNRIAEDLNRLYRSV
jgi:glycosyltransferase involved in cell wall biosynthesis